MHLLIVTVGTRGDVQPYVALGLGLQRRGYTVTVASHREHESFVGASGLSFRNGGSSMRETLDSDIGRAWIESSDSLLQYTKTAKRVGEHMWPEALAIGESMTEKVDAVLFHPFATHAMHHAEARRLPSICLPLVPIFPSRIAPPVFLPRAPAWGWLRGAITDSTLKMIYKTVEHMHEAHRRKLGLGRLGPNIIRTLHQAGVPFVHLYSGHVAPRPGDWPDDVTVTGFCVLDAPSGYSPPEALTRFLDAGPPPIYVGFGSMTGLDPKDLTRMIREAVERAGVRAVVCTGWGGIGPLDAGDHVLQIDDVPHHWLFPRVRAVVHHGGAGTLAAGLRAGRPTVIAAFFGDQHFWGEMAAQRGACPKPLARRTIDASRLAEAIRTVLASDRYAAAAVRMQEALAAENGVANAVEQIEKHLDRPRASFWTRSSSNLQS
jgi:sterol 3beta-glucosyltransferase